MEEATILLSLLGYLIKPVFQCSNLLGDHLVVLLRCVQPAHLLPLLQHPRLRGRYLAVQLLDLAPILGRNNKIKPACALLQYLLRQAALWFWPTMPSQLFAVAVDSVRLPFTLRRRFGSGSGGTRTPRTLKGRTTCNNRRVAQALAPALAAQDADTGCT